MAMDQLILRFAAEPSYRAEDFLVSDSNRKAWMWLQPGQYWPQPVFLLQGPHASGKSHLAAIWANQHQAPVIGAETLTTARDPAEYFASGHCLVVENIEKAKNETVLLHLFNFSQQQEKSLLMTVDSAACWDHFKLPDLRSRLQATTQAQISQPDDMLLAAVLIKHLTDRQLGWNDALIAYILPRLERSFAAVRQVAEKLDELALRKKQALSVALAREVLTQF